MANRARREQGRRGTGKGRRVDRPAPHSKAQLARANRRRATKRGPVAYRQRSRISPERGENFTAPEDWHEPRGDGELRFVVQQPGSGWVHPVTVEEVRDRLRRLPLRFRHAVETVQFSRMTRKQTLFPNYGMQWGTAVYLYPIEESLIESYLRPPRPAQLVEARMYGGRWEQRGELWRLHWTPDTIRDFYLNNVLVHEVGHVVDERNTTYVDRERYAEWFAIEYGYKPTR
jgi:hypothetical protein